MSTLSNVDIINELGENLYIYPLYSQNIKGASINLTASKFAWSIKTKKLVSDTNTKKIIIPPHDTVLIETEEVIYVSDNLSGVYHSKVRLVSKGIGHISTTLDPKYIGTSLIALPNTTDESIELKIGETMVTLTLEYLETSATKMHNNSSGQLQILNGYENFDEIDVFLDQDWCKNADELLKKMKTSKDYETIEKKKRSTEQQTLKYKMKYVKAYALVVFGIVLFLVAECFIERRFFIQQGNLIVFNWLMYAGFSGIIVPPIVAGTSKYINTRINGGIG